MVAPIPLPPVPALPRTPAPGRMGVDFEQRVDFARLREYRLGRAMAALEASDLGALLVYDNNNIRYLTGVAIGEWTRDKLCRYALYTRTGELFLWDFGSAAVHHRMYCPWLKPEHCIASYTTMRGATAPEAHLPERAVTEIKGILAGAGVAGMPVGVDFAELSMLFELQRQGLDVRDGQQVMLDARQLKSADEIALLTTAAAMVDGVYQEITDALKPGVSTDQVARLWPAAPEFGLPDEKTAFGLQFGHGLGLALHERPIISRLSSLDAPMEIQKGMVFAVETYCPASDGVSAARLEEEVVVVDDGVEIITRFPSKELFVTNPY